MVGGCYNPDLERSDYLLTVIPFPLEVCRCKVGSTSLAQYSGGYFDNHMAASWYLWVVVHIGMLQSNTDGPFNLAERAILDTQSQTARA